MEERDNLENEDAGLPILPPAERPSALVQVAYVLGSIGLLSSTAVDAIAVTGRHVGFTFLGSIEIVESTSVLTATSAMVMATAVGAHASVHIFTQRMSESTRRVLARGAAALGALLFALVLAGSAWVAAEMWPGFERTELLAIDVRWLRGFWVLGALLICAIFARQALRRRA